MSVEYIAEGKVVGLSGLGGLCFRGEGPVKALGALVKAVFLVPGVLFTQVLKDALAMVEIKARACNATILNPKP